MQTLSFYVFVAYFYDDTYHKIYLLNNGLSASVSWAMICLIKVQITGTSMVMARDSHAYKEAVSSGMSLLTLPWLSSLAIWTLPHTNAPIHHEAAILMVENPYQSWHYAVCISNLQTFS